MDGLRWLLLFFGLLVIAGVYLYSRRDNSTAGNQEPVSPRVEPLLEGSESSGTLDIEVAEDEPFAVDEESGADSEEAEAPQ